MNGMDLFVLAADLDMANALEGLWRRPAAWPGKPVHEQQKHPYDRKEPAQVPALRRVLR